MLFPQLDPEVGAYVDAMLHGHNAKLRRAADRFHQYAYNGFDWAAGSWRGASLQKSPLDLMVMQDLAYRLKPDLIIETGTSLGGSALFWSDMCRLNGKGRVISIDYAHYPKRPLGDPKIEYLLGSSISPDVFGICMNACRTGDVVLVDLDSAHDKLHVLAEMEMYGPLVSPGSYMLVEDTNINGHPVYKEYGPGPWEAVAEYLLRHPEFVPDKYCERYGITFNPGGWLRRVGA